MYATYSISYTKISFTTLKIIYGYFYSKSQPIVVTNRWFHWLSGEVHDPKAYQLKQHCGSAGLFAGIPDLIYFSRWLLGKVQPAFAPVSQKILKQLFQSFTNVVPVRSFLLEFTLGSVKTTYFISYWLYG